MNLFNIPLSLEKADRLVSVLRVTANDHVVDAGCGRGEFLIRVVDSTGATGLGIDIDEASIAAARECAANRIAGASCEFRVANVQTESLQDNSFALAICLGSTHAFGAGDSAYPNTLRALGELVRPEGHLLIGEGYWKQPPAPEYLQLIGEPVGIYRDHAGNIAFAEQQGLIADYALVSNEDEWDHFEWSHRMRIEHHAAQHPDDPQLAERLKRSRAWRDGYLRWGRSTMGFGFYLFRRPARMTSAET